MYIISSKHSIHVSNRPFKILETFLLLLNRNIYAHTLLLLSPYSPQIVARHDPSQKIGKINFLSRLSLSLSKKIFDQRKKGGREEESNDDAADARFPVSAQNRKGLIYPCGGIALRGNRHVFTRVIPNRDRITAFRRASNLIATRALAASPKIHYIYTLTRVPWNAAKRERERGGKEKRKEEKREERTKTRRTRAKNTRE